MPTLINNIAKPQYKAIMHGIYIQTDNKSLNVNAKIPHIIIKIIGEKQQKTFLFI
jgi:hypothetical protein